MGSEASRLLIIGGNFKRMGGREEEGLADIEEGTARLLEFGRMVDAHAYGDDDRMRVAPCGPPRRS